MAIVLTEIRLTSRATSNLYKY